MTTENNRQINQWQEEVEQHYQVLLKKSFPKLKSAHKWRQTMWHIDERLIVCLVFGKNQIKFCFFNNLYIKLDKLQRWGHTIHSQNLEIENGNFVDWKYIEELIKKTINL